MSRLTKGEEEEQEEDPGVVKDNEKRYTWLLVFDVYSEPYIFFGEVQSLH